MLAPAGVISTVSYVKKGPKKCRKIVNQASLYNVDLFLFIVFHLTNLEASSTFGCLFQHPTARIAVLCQEIRLLQDIDEGNVEKS